MEKTYKCLICLDCGYLATHANDPNDVIPMIDLAGLGTEEYRLSKCNCQVKTKSDEAKEYAEKLKKGSKRKVRR